VAKGDKQLDPHYESIKQQLRNKPQALKFLKQLEMEQAPSSMLEDVANKFVAGQHGDAEIWAAFCTEVLRNFDPKAILKRVADLRSVGTRVLFDLSHIASEIEQLKNWEANQEMGFEDWTEFSEQVLGLSDKVADSLLLAREQVADRSLNLFLQAVIKGYAAPAISQEQQSLMVQKLLQRRSDPKSIIKELNAQKEWMEFRLGEEIRARKAAEEEAVRARAEKYREVQKRDAMNDKLIRSMDSQVVKPLDNPPPTAKNVRHKVIRMEDHPQSVRRLTRKGRIHERVRSTGR